MANVNFMNEHFTSLKKVLNDHNIFDKPMYIFNGDESGINLDVNAGKVMVAKSSKQAYSESKGSHSHITAHCCCCHWPNYTSYVNF